MYSNWPVSSNTIVQFPMVQYCRLSSNIWLEEVLPHGRFSEASLPLVVLIEDISKAEAASPSEVIFIEHSSYGNVVTKFSAIIAYKQKSLKAQYTILILATQH